MSNAAGEYGNPYAASRLIFETAKKSVCGIGFDAKPIFWANGDSSNASWQQTFPHIPEPKDLQKF